MSANISETHWWNVLSLPDADSNRRWQAIISAIYSAGRGLHPLEGGIELGQGSHPPSAGDVSMMRIVGGVAYYPKTRRNYLYTNIRKDPRCCKVTQSDVGKHCN